MLSPNSISILCAKAVFTFSYIIYLSISLHYLSHHYTLTITVRFNTEQCDTEELVKGKALG